MAAALVATKAAIIFGLARLFGMDWRQSLGLGLLLSQGGEFGFVLFAQAQAAMLIEPEAASLFGAIVTVSMATTPFLMRFSRRLRAAAAPARTDLAGPVADGASAIIVGYGRFGQTVGQMLLGQRISVTLIDRKPSQIDVSTAFGVKVHYGDGTRIDLLRQAGAAEAALILFCHDDPEFSAEQVAQVAAQFPNAAILVRVFDRKQVLALCDAPVAATVREVYESAICMGREAMKVLEIDEDEIDNAERDYRDRDADRLGVQYRAGSLLAARGMLLSPGKPIPSRE